ncbi:MAG TPA: hypothetical protein VFU13_12220 [Steroidobacteraceae bacterium]|nr:hypothetical protein [Steroidobacteraceae bacterium]
MKRFTRALVIAASTCLVSLGAHAQAPQQEDRLQALQRQLAEQSAKLEQLQAQLSEQEDIIASLRQAVGEEILEQQRGGGAGAAEATPPAPPAQPVGEAPKRDTRPPEVARIFSEPTALTRGGDFVLEPSLQSAYWASDRVALVGYTVIPAILIGLVDVRRVKTTNMVGALTARYGVRNRFEFEMRAPYLYTSVDTVSREILTGSAVDNVFNADGHGLGDIDATMRYQFNRGDYSKPFWLGWLRYRWHTGKDPFEVTTDCVQRCVANTTGTGLPLETPTGTGFNAAQAGLTWLYASDPAVFFGGVSYLHSFPRDNLSRTLLLGEKEFLGEIAPGDIFGFNVGMGLSLNEKASFSIGYDQSIIGRTKQNGVVVPGAVRTTLGNLLIGVSYRYNPTSTLNFSVGVGVTRDTPDVSFTMRAPITF